MLSNSHISSGNLARRLRIEATYPLIVACAARTTRPLSVAMEYKPAVRTAEIPIRTAHVSPADHRRRTL